MKKVLIRLKETAKLERLIKEGYSYEEILKQSKVVDKCIQDEIKAKMEE